jgi:hypothetical protein
MEAMIYHGTLRKFSLWLAIFAVLLASLAPSVSRIAFRQTFPVAGWVEICTTAGTRQLPVSLFEDTRSPAPEDSGSHIDNPFEHCPFCLTNASSFGLMPVEAALPPLMAAKDHPLLVYALFAPHTQSVWQPRQTRAPPVFL